MEAIPKDLSTPIHVFTQHPSTPEKFSVTGVARSALFEQNHVAEKPQHEWGEVVVLIGTSTAGKTSIITELIKQKPGMVEQGVDLAFQKIPLAYLNENHKEVMDYLRLVIEPTEMDIKNSGYVLDYILFNKEPNFKVDVSPTDRDRYAEVVKKVKESLLKDVPGENIVNIMMDQIMIDSKRGSPVVFDVLHVKEVADHILAKEHPSVKFALVYVPFQTLAERVIKRNEDAIVDRDFSNARPGLFPLEQFTKIFRPKRDDHDDVVQKLTFKEAEYAIDTVYENGRSFLEKYEPQGLERLQEEKADTKRKILKKLGFKEGDDPYKVVDLTPRYKGYDILINTAQTKKPKAEAVKESVQQILFKK